MLRPFLVIVSGVCVVANPNCQVGFGYAGRGEPTRSDINSLRDCQSLCQDQCAHFTYDHSAKECWLLGQETKLQAEVGSVSGAPGCEMPRWKAQVQETESERSKRIHTMISTIATQVAERSKDEVIIGMAKHLEYSAQSGYLKQEKYDNLIAVLNAEIAEMGSESVEKQVADGRAIPTRDDLDWLVAHMLGEKMVVGRPSNVTSISGSSEHSAGKPWTNAEVKYCFDQYIAVSARSAVDCAIGKIRSELPGVHFTNVGYRGRDVCNVHPAIFIQSSDSGCWSNLGMQTANMMALMGLEGNQKINLQAPGCSDCGTAIHEMLHAMGMAHEQTRPDRDSFVTIEWTNIKTSMFSQFTKNPHADTSLPYDILSIMHYGQFSDSKNGEPTIVVKDAGYHLYTDDPDKYSLYQIGQRAMMTKNDVSQLARMYDCTSRSVCGVSQTSSTPPPNVDDNGEGQVHHGPQTDWSAFGNQGAVVIIVGTVIGLIIAVAICCFCTRSSSSKADDEKSLLAVDGP